MSVLFKLKPGSARLSETKSVEFTLSGLLHDLPQRVKIENVTYGHDCAIENAEDGYIRVPPGTDEISGRVDLQMPEYNESSVVSIYANVEQQGGENWHLKDIAAFAFQIEYGAREKSQDRISVSPAFVGPDDQAVIEVKSKPDSRVKVWINGRGFIVRTNNGGEGKMHLRGIDLMTGSPFSAGSINKFPVTFAKSDDGFAEVYEAGIDVHYVPETMRVLQATNDPVAPECAILDPDPPPGLRLRTLDDFCFRGAVVGDPTIFDSESDYVNSRIGYCGPVSEASIAPVTPDGICRIYNNIDTSLLPNGSGVAAFASAFDPSVDADLTRIPSLSSRIYVAHTPSTLKFNGNPVRNGTILRPPRFYHSFTLEEAASEGFIGIVFRLGTGEFTEVRYEIGVDAGDPISVLAERIRESELLTDNRIEIFVTGSRIDVFSETRFSIRSNVVGDSTASAELNSNKTLEILVANENALDDEGNTLVFLDPQLGSQTYPVVGKTIPSVLRIDVPEGVNNNIGPTVAETLYCQEFVIVSSSSPSSDGLDQVNPLPYIVDPFQRELPASNPAIACRRDRDSGASYCYVICQAPVDGVYQLFFFSFALGTIDANLEWQQITFEGENKNARAECDEMGNLHVVWESDRAGGPSQVYYGVLGPGARVLSNQILVSALEKEQLHDDDFLADLVEISDPTALQDTWTRFLHGVGGCSISDAQTVGIDGNPVDGSAMAVFRLDQDQDEREFDGLFSQLSYQVSFDLSVESLGQTPFPELSSADVDRLFRDFKSQFTKSVSDQYIKNGNVFTLDEYGIFYDKMIPIVGAYKFGDFSTLAEAGGTGTRHVSHNLANEFVSSEDTQLVAANAGDNLRHFMIALMPEKIRFKALNVDPVFGFLDRNELSQDNAGSYIPQIEEIVYTGRYKMALVLATSEDESTGDAASKKYHLLRQFGDPISFEQSKNIKVAVHYSKANQDFIDGRMRANPYVSEQNSRFYGDIIVTIDDEVALGESFVADFSDQYRAFDIGLGWLDNNVFITQEQVPFDGNQYDKQSVLLTYENIAIGPHSIQPNQDYINLSAYDRSTTQMVVPETINDILLNGDFESNTLPVETFVNLINGDESIAPWVIGNSVAVGNTQAGFISFIGNYAVALNGIDDSLLGFVEQTVDTVPGENYIVSFVLSSNPLASTTLGTDVTRKVRVTATPGSVDKTFETTIRVGETVPNWTTHTVSFVASSTSTTIRFANNSDSQSPFTDFGPIIDSVRLYQVSAIPNELVSQSAKDELLVSSAEYAINYTLSTFGNMSRLPVTLSTIYQNRNPDLDVDAMDKAHIAWQSNRNEFWDIYYTGMTCRAVPFRFETRITNSESNSIEPSIAADKRGRKLIAWQDNRRGRYNQIYAALNKTEDPMYINQCGIDEVNEFIYQREENLDPYDPYLASVPEPLTCGVEFAFEPETSGTYYFVLKFYVDREKTTLYQTIDSRDSILGWKINGAQMNADGIFVPRDEEVSVSYTVSDEDELSDGIYYVDVVFESLETNEADVVSANISDVDPPINQSFEAGELESANVVYFKETFAEVSFTQQPQTVDTILDSIDQSESIPTIIIGGNGQLAGFQEDDIVASYYLHFDPASAGSAEFSITFEGPVVAVYAGKSSLDATNSTLGRGDIIYPTDASTGGLDSPTDVLTISSDKRTISGVMNVAENLIDTLRVVVEPLAETSGTDDFVYNCPFKQSRRCAVETDYFNPSDLDQNNLHFRITFFADNAMNSAIFSAFSLFDTDGWVFGPDGFPAEGINVTGGDTATIAFDPEVLPFEKFEDQGGQEERRTVSSYLSFGGDSWQISDLSGTMDAVWDNDSGAGAIVYEDAVAGSPGWFLAPPKFHGNFESHYGGEFEVAMRLDTEFSPSISSRDFTIEIESTLGGTLRYVGSEKPGRSSSYTLFSVPLSAGNPNWTHEPAGGGGFSAVSETEFRAVMSDIEQIRVAADFYNDADKSYLSSFVLSSSRENVTPSFKKPLICGVNYYYKIERFFEGVFTTVKESTFLCPCFETDADIWREDKDSDNWLCSGQGFDDFRITQTDREAIHANVNSATNDLFYISWQDYRFTRMQNDQPALSPDYFFGVYSANDDKFFSSAQGSYDRRMTFFSDGSEDDEGGLVLFDASVFIDPFQNINVAFHDGSKIYHQGCSIGCAYEPFNPERIVPCMFTDGTDDDFYFVTAGPERDIEQYQKMRVRDEYVVYSTYLDTDTPIPVINDCFIELDIIGVPGTYAFRLKNEEDDDFTEWLPIGPSLPEQPGDTDETQAERDFFKGYFVGRDRFIAPWIASAGNGTKRVCCEILTYFGKTEQFCVDFQATYKELEYKIDFFFDAEFTLPVADFNGYPVLTTKETPTRISEEDLRSIAEEVTEEEQNTIYVRVSFNDPQRLELLERTRGLSRFGLASNLTFSVYQQGLNDQLNLPLTRVSDGVYSGTFIVEEDDSVVNVDGLGVILINVPGQCNPLSFDDQNERLLQLLSPQNLDQRITILNDLDVFIENYNDDDVRGSFGNPAYYKKNRFGIQSRGKEDIGETGGNNQWAGGGDGPLETPSGE